MTVCKSLFRWTLIGGLATAGITVLVGPDRVAAAFSQVQLQAGDAVDAYINADEARQLRTRLQSLADEYPDRIRQVRLELAKVQAEVTRFDREMDVARRVVQMTEHDLEALADRVHTAETHGVQTVSLTTNGTGVNLDKAYREGRRIRSVRDTYRQRLATDEQQVDLLRTQQTRLEELLGRLESEFADYRAQAWQLDRQIDAIQRNERLIALTEQQQATMQSFESPGQEDNLRQIEDRLAEMRAVQESTLQSLAAQERTLDYESIAEQAADAGSFSSDPFAEYSSIPPTLALDATR
ncbi:MAG: hypothetical protein MK074_09220 [Phycisphaerales bacterium]|nr:hypothetical protein [Phycisphaerales bacterium]